MIACQQDENNFSWLPNGSGEHQSLTVGIIGDYLVAAPQAVVKFFMPCSTKLKRCGMDDALQLEKTEHIDPNDEVLFFGISS
jgi:hypothetical protein